MRRQSSRDCPFCGAKEALIIFGARAATLLSAALGQAFGSRHNDDRKVIAFSDNVQDAAHRAGFIGARTWTTGLRAALAQTIHASEGISLAELAGTSAGDPGRVVRWWSDRSVNPEAFDPERFVAEFLAPDRHWLRDFIALQREGRLPASSDLPELVAERLRWETLAELGYKSTIGRTLERTRVAAVGVDRQRLEGAVASLHDRLREEFGSLRNMRNETVRALLLGILWRMRMRGAAWSATNEEFLRRGARLRWLNRKLALQEFGKRSARPVFPSDGKTEEGLEPLVGRRRRRSWYRSWTEKMLRQPPLALAQQEAPRVLAEAVGELAAAGLVRRVPLRDADAWALDPAHFRVTPRVAEMRSARSGRSLAVAEDETDLWRGLPCFDLASNETWTDAARAPRTWFGELYRRTALRRVVAAEHTALLTRDQRERLQRRFAAPDPHPWEPNLLSATPTLELGIDIGDVSSVVLCSVPPAPENHVQRSGRAGRRDGNAFTLTLAAASPHDLHFYAEPLDMLAGQVNPPGVFLNASAVLERQLTAFCFDRWSASGVGEEAVPPRIRAVLDAVETTNTHRFPFPFLAFVQREGEALLEAFFSAFAPDLEDRSKDYLAGFLLGEAGEDAPLQFRLFERLEERVRERRSLRNGIRTLRRWVRKLGNGPRDEATKAEIGELDRERKGLGSVLRTLNGQHTFNFLTDSGFLPNYAFPEEGITLKSVIYRTRERRAGEGSADRGHEHETFEYVRPAASALSEFAPENPFYAGARRVSMNRVDLQVSEIEDWRLCRQCPFAESVAAKDPHRTCPRCGDAMWADAGQLRKLLRLRLVHAFEPDRRSRILDQREEREPVFYTRELVADIAPEKVERAFAVTRPEAAFGFEYVSSATFRDLNFGRLDEGGQPTTFAGRKRGRPGFRVCRQCGSVQGRKEDPPEHTRTCRLHGKPAKESGEAVVECLYLYREFRSEALRMLLPGGGGDRSDPRTVSFVAALELGLRRRFRGRIEHLRVLPAEYPAADGLRRGCLVLYDTVPGGTGYLKELMTAPDQLAAVFRAAREALRTCPCAADPERDGCHRCLFAYRRSREMARTSRTAAVEMLDSLLEHASALEEVEELGRVKPRGPLQSELEERFVEALRRVSIGGEPARVRRDPVGGRPGYVLQAGERTWYLEPQVEFGRSEGVAVPSRADFRIRPARSDPGQPPLAVFLDGFAWHRETTAADSAKRMALVRAGYRVWSLTWQDLEEAFDGSAEAPDLLAAPAGAHGMAPLQRVLDRRWGTGPLRAGRGASSLALLRRWLADPDADRWKRAVFTRLFQQFERERMRSPAFRRAFAAAAAGTLPGVVRDRLAGCGEDSVVAGRGRWAGGDGPVEFFLAMPLSAVRRGEPDAMTAVVHLRDDEASRQTKGYRQLWNGALRAFNLLQFLPGGFWTTRLGVQGERYPEFAPPRETAPADGGEPWEEALEMADREIRPLLRELAERGAPAPELGFERTGRDGAVVAEAEAAWPSRRVAVLLPDQRRGSSGFRKAGWTVVVSPGADAAAAAAAALALSARGETSATSDALVGLAERGRPVGAAGNAGLRNAVATRDPAGNNRPTRAAPRPAGASR